MQLLKTYTDGDYTVNKYDNGTVEKYLTGSDQPIDLPPQLLSETEEMIMDTNTRVVYLECLAELSLGGGGRSLITPEREVC